MYKFTSVIKNKCYNHDGNNYTQRDQQAAKCTAF